MKISEALEIANDIRNGCRNVGEADAILALADAIEVMSTAERNLLLGCERGQHKSCTVQFEDGTSLAFCEVCGTHWPFDKGAKSKRAMWYASVVRTEVAKNIALIRSHESEPCSHAVVAHDKDDGATCSNCGKDLGWYCHISQKHYCEYTDDECCIHCGAPEERQ